MASERPETINEYIRTAPPQGQSHLSRLHGLLREVAPGAEETIKRGVPHSVELRFLFSFSFSAFNAHLALVPSEATLDAFRAETGDYATTENFLMVRYDQPLPEALIRRMAERQVRTVSEREGDSFRCGTFGCSGRLDGCHSEPGRWVAP